MKNQTSFTKTIHAARLLAAALVMFAAPVICRADALSLVFTPATQNDAPGGTVSFTGTITNTSAATVFVNGDSFTGLSSLLSVDDTAFGLATPFTLTAGAKYPVTGSANLFTATLDPTATLGHSYTGIFNILGGANTAAQSIQGNATFTVTAAAVPEATTTVSFGLMLLGAGLLAVKTRNRNSNAA